MNLSPKPTICRGQGECLQLAGRGLFRYAFECMYDCKPVTCANYLFCRGWYPAMDEYFNNQCCMRCTKIFGGVQLEFKRCIGTESNPFRCLRCNGRNVQNGRDGTVSVLFPECVDHYVCIYCLKRNPTKCPCSRRLTEPLWKKQKTMNPTL